MADRPVLERLLGQKLRERQQLVIQLVGADLPIASESSDLNGSLPAWCNVLNGLSDADTARLGEIWSQRANLTRQFE